MKKRINMKLWAALLPVVACLVLTSQPVGAACTYSLFPTSRTHGYGATNNTVVVTTSATCAWTVVNTNGWITILSAPIGTNSGTVAYAVDANPSLVARTGVVTIADQPFTLRQSGITCDYSISPTSSQRGYGMSSGSIIVTTSNGCAWAATSTNSWITITSGASGTGSGTVAYSFEANSSFEQRTGLVMIADQIFTLIQDAASCTYSITPGTRMHGYGASTGAITVTTATGCNWLASPSVGWISITAGGSGSGNGSVAYAVDANPSTTGRTGTVMIADRVFTVIQSGTSCTVNLSPGSRNHGHGGASNFVTVNVGAACNWDVINSNSWLKIVPGYSGMGGGTVGYTVDPNPTYQARIGVVMIGTQNFTVNQSGIPCNYSISPSTRSHGYGAATNTINVTAAGACSWTVINTNSWITISSGVSGLGTGVVTYVTDLNPSVSPRSGLIMIDGQTFTLNQAGFVCGIKLSPSNRMHGFSAATNSVGVNTTTNCSWAVVNTNDWITIQSEASGAGTGTVTYAIPVNLNTTDRTGVVMVADQMLTVTQHGNTNSIFSVYFEAITSIVDGQVTLTLMGVPGGVWELQSSQDLEHWEKISNFTNTTGMVEYSDTMPVVPSRRFYRAVLP